MRTTLSLTLFALALASSTAAFAQDQSARCRDASSTGANSQDQTFCFQGEDVQSSLVGATGQGVRQLRHPHGVSLIRIRAHFVPEMLRSVENE